MPKIQKYSGKNTITVRTNQNPDPRIVGSQWWILDKKQLPGALFGTVKYLRDNQSYRQNQAGLYARLYCNLPMGNYFGATNRILDAKYKFPNERPTMNVVSSMIDALVSRLTQSQPKPMFLTDAGNYKKRLLGKKLNKFTDGIFYDTKAYQVGDQALLDSCVLGDGLIKIIETDDHKAGIERVLCTELFVDEVDGKYGFPTQMHQLKVIDRDVAAALFPSAKGAIMTASGAYFDQSSESTNSIASQIMICESWHLKSSDESKDQRHCIVIENAVLHDDKDEDEKTRWDGEDFPFVKASYAPRLLGYWAQGIPERVMGIQSEVNRLLYTIQMSLHLCGIPKWLVEEGSRVVSAHLNNQIGGLVKYQGSPPVLQIAQSVAPDTFKQLEWLITAAYQQEGISQLAAASQKPAGLNSGAALREYDDLQTDRFAFLAKRREAFFMDLAKKLFKKACDIAKRDGEYETLYPSKDGITSMDLPELMKELEDDDFVIQAYPVSAFSKNPAQRKQEIIELMQAGLIEPEQGRRLLDYPDIQQEEDLLNAAEERILKVLDDIVDEGKYMPPDPDMDLQKAKIKIGQYLNKYLQQNLEEDKADMLRTFKLQIMDMEQKAEEAMMAQQQAMMVAQNAVVAPQGAVQPQAVPEAPPVSPMVPNIPAV